MISGQITCTEHLLAITNFRQYCNLPIVKQPVSVKIEKVLSSF